MDDKIVLICATGRSGSTTLQRILNTMSNTNICGENFAAIISLLEFYRRIKETTHHFVPGQMHPLSYDELVSAGVKPSWYNSFHYGNIVMQIKVMIVNMFKNKESTNTWGFKEIRYDSGNIQYINDFKELFPQTKVIIHVRENIQQQSNSGWFKGDQSAPAFLMKTSKELITFAAQHKEWCFVSTFERMFDLAHLHKLFLFLDCGEKFHVDKITKVLQNNLKD